MNRTQAVLLTLGGLSVTIGVSYFFLVFAGAAAGNNAGGSHFLGTVVPIAITLLVIQAFAAITLLLLNRNVASVIVAVGPLVLALITRDLLRYLGWFSNLFS